MNPSELRQWLTRHLASHLALPAAGIDPDRPLHEYGLDSAYALTLAADLFDTYGLIAEPTLTWDHPTIETLARYLATQPRPL